MPQTVANGVAAPHLSRLESLRLSPAKANLNGVEMPTAERVRAGRALAYAIKFLGIDDKQAAEMLGDIDKGQLSRWLSGKERLHVDRVLGTRLHGPFVIALADGADGVSVDTVITVRRSA